MYGELRSYADSGVVLREYGSRTDPSRDRHTFTTYFSRSPRRFLLDFRKQGGDQFVVWGDPDAFHTWWKTTGGRYDYPNPNNLPAINGSGANTSGSVLKIPTLLYGKAPLQGDLTYLRDVGSGGFETVDGRRCDRVTATTYGVYGTGHEFNVHAITVWIDVESLLIRKIVEEWPPLPGQISRTTTTFEPQANPSLDEARFRFVPPQ